MKIYTDVEIINADYVGIDHNKKTQTYGVIAITYHSGLVHLIENVPGLAEAKSILADMVTWDANAGMIDIPAMIDKRPEWKKYFSIPDYFKEAPENEQSTIN